MSTFAVNVELHTNYIPCQDAMMVSGTFFDFMPPLGNWGLLFYVSYHLPLRGGGVKITLQRLSVQVWGNWGL